MNDAQGNRAQRTHRVARIVELKTAARAVRLQHMESLFATLGRHFE
jgi:hypothetical protein